MATLNEDKNNNRSDSTRIYNIGQTSLAQLRPEKLDDTALKTQISLIQEACGDISPDLIALVFHECDYNMQTTIARIKAGDYEGGGWQTAKSNNKKKNHNNNNNNLGDQLFNGSTQSDSERSLSQRTSPTSSLRSGAIGERRRKDQYNNNRRRNDFNRNSYNSSNLRYSNNNNTKLNEIPLTSSKINEEITPTTSSSTDEYEFIGGTSQSLTFDNSLKKSPLTSLTKRPIISSSIPQEPVSMHPTIQFSTEPIDIQFGDVQWNDSIPIAITPPPSNSPILTKSLDEQQTDVQDNLSTNIIDRELHEATSAFEITTNPLTNNSTEETSHLSDHLNDSSQQITSNSSPTSQTTNNQFLLNQTNTNSSAFTPYTTPNNNNNNFQRDYSQTWNQQKSTTKSTMLQTGNYPPQTSYQLPHQQQYYVGPYPYHTPHTIYPILTSVDPWSTAGYEPFPTYPTTNFLPTYSTQQAAYHPNTKHDHYSYDKDFFAHYGQNRITNNELMNSSQSTKDVSITASKLSPTAASFSQATSPATTFYINPVLYTVPPTYYASHQDRTMTYDNRNGASYSNTGNNNRNHYQQQRTHNNSNWHSQQ